MDGRPSKRQLEIQLGKLQTLDSPRLRLEQYPVSPEVASQLLYMAGFERPDLDDKTVDLGCGTGRLAVGAALMGSRFVLGVDIDRRAVGLAVKNAAETGVQVEWVKGDISCVVGEFDTVIMNPPYGTRRPHSDVEFLRRAFQLAPVVYSIHKSSTREFLKVFMRKQGRRIDDIRGMSMRIPHMFSFHEEKWKTIEVDIYRIVS